MALLPSATRLNADEWTSAAYARFREHGLEGVRIEAIARRGALVAAVMERWAREQTEHFALLADAEQGPRERLEVLLRAVSERRIPGEISLYLDAERDGVSDQVRGVTERRVTYVASALAEMGVEADEARRRALIAVAGALGLELLARGGAGALLGNRAELVRSVLGAMTAPQQVCKPSTQKLRIVCS